MSALVECPTCTQSVMMTGYKLCKRDLTLLRRFIDEVGGVGHVTTLKETFGYSDKGNIISLWRFGLTEPVAGSKGTGWWRVTNLGRLWVEGKVKVPLMCWAYKYGNIVRYSAQLVGCDEVTGRRDRDEALKHLQPWRGEEPVPLHLLDHKRRLPVDAVSTLGRYVLR